MPDPASLRVMDIIAQWFLEDPGIVTCSTNLRDYTLVPMADKPALYVTRGTPREELVGESSLGIAEPLAIDLIGYAEAPNVVAGVPVTPDTNRARELFLQLVIRRLYNPDVGGDSLKKRLEADFIANGNGAMDLRHVAPPLTDQGYEPPHGIFELPCLAILHYEGSTF